ncbi:ParB N-terminal domain-containing protein [Dendronalium sp. ChiSLP03b]|uniref:ParB N-terminal domain-containing protein n=1 Tax=Dendronalium sp. ChiSLP03b TaxID=3075381 RepID=UPI00391DCB3F
MTQIAEVLKPCNPCDIRILENISADEIEVGKVISAYHADGIIPDIIATENWELIEGINALEAAIRLNQQVVMVKVRQENKSHIKRNLTLLSTSLLYTHPLNSSIYGEREDLTRLKQSIAETGWIKPLVVTPDADGKRYRVVDGNSCFKVCVELQIAEVWVEIKEFKNEQEELKALLAGNVAREKTIEQKVREGQLWEQIERCEAKSRQGRAGEGQGTTRDIIAKRVGLGSGVNYEHAAAAVKTLDETNDPGLRSQLKIALSKPRGVDAAYKLVAEGRRTTVATTGGTPARHCLQKAEGRGQKRWIPKELERVKIIDGPHKGKNATVRVLTGICAIVHVDGTPDPKREQIPFNQMEALEEEAQKPITSVTQESKQKQQELGLGKRREQVLPDLARNTGVKPEEQLQASATNLNVAGDALVGEVAIALLKLSPKQMSEVMLRVGPDLSVPQLEAIWQALGDRLAHKAA